MMKQVYALSMIWLILAMPMASAVLIIDGSVESTGVTDSSATIKWETNVISDGIVEYGPRISSMEQVPETGGQTDEHSVQITGLVQGQKYYYQVKSDGSGGPASSDYYDFTTRLSAPAGLKATDVNAEDVELSWNANSKADKYKVFRDGSYLESTEEDYLVVDGLSPATSYEFQVSVVDTLGRESEKSEAVTVETVENPVGISFIDASGVSTTSATITWKTDIEINCTLFYGPDTSLSLKKRTAAAKSHSVPLSGLEVGKRYYYQAKCKDTMSARDWFETLSEEPELIISDINTGYITKDSATITWTTNVDANSKVVYSIDDSLDLTSSDTERTTSHSIELTGLDSGATYYFKVISDDVESAVMDFTTIESIIHYTTIDDAVRETRNRTYTVSGNTRANSRVYIIVNEQSLAQVREQITGTQFSFDIQLDPTVRYNGLVGNNRVEVATWDPSGIKDSIVFYVYVDTNPPMLSVDPIPLYTREMTVNVSGTVERNTTLQMLMNGQVQAETDTESTGNIDFTLNTRTADFSYSMRLGRDDEHNITVVAIDRAGNRNEVNLRTILDNKAPTIEFLPDRGAYSKSTHFKILEIKGKTDPNTKIKAVNFGSYSGCDDPDFRTRYGQCSHFVYDQDQYDQFVGLIDPVTYGIGMQVSTESDDSGEFSLRVSLLPDEDGGSSTNRIRFNLTDAAGNLNDDEYLDVKYEPGCSDWISGNVESYPFNIYTKELREGIDAQVFFPIQYVGTGTPKVAQVYVTMDDSIHGDLMQNDDDMSELISFPDNNIRVSQYDTSTNQLYVQVPIKIGPYKGDVDNLPDQLNAYFGAEISYSIDGNEAPCEVYTIAAFSVQKPEDLSSWLSPTMINNTIEMLDKMINNTRKMVDTLETASMVGLITCGVMIAFDYMKGLFGGADAEDGECTSNQNGMESTYWVCDRILCPTVPPRCDDFAPDLSFNGNAEDEAAWYDQRAINDAWRDSYLESGYPGTFEKYREENAATLKAEFGDYDTNLRKPETYSMSRTLPNGEDQTYILRYHEVDENGNFADSNYWKTFTDDNGRTIISVDHEARQTAKSCKDGTVVEVQTKSSSGSATQPVNIGESVGSFEFQCVKNLNPDELGQIDSSVAIEGCYNPECPQFDQTKCFDRDGVAPPGDLWSSLLCACLPGMMAHLQNYLKIMEAAKKCLIQAREGKVRGGYCERLLAQFVCDLLIEAFKILLNYYDGDSYGYGDSGGTGGRGVLGDYAKNSKQISSDLSDRYGDIVKSSAGLSSDRLVNKACVVAFTGDWSLLDGILQNVVDTVEVEPMAWLEGSSRPAGFDKFTGRMSISYDLYVSIIPGGETDVKVWLECDRSFNGGKYCGQDADPIRITEVPAHLSKEDFWEKNIMFTDDNAIFRYNKLVMELKYNINGEPRTEMRTKELWQKGDISASCHVDAFNGIICEGISELSPSGIVEILDAKLSPQVVKYGDGDRVNALVQIRNAYVEPFYITIDYPGTTRKALEYRIESASDGFQELQYFNLIIDNEIGVVDSNTGAVTGDGWLLAPNANPTMPVSISVSSPIKQVDADITVYFDGESQDRTVRCIVPNDEAGATFRKGVYINGQFVSETDTGANKLEWCKKKVSDNWEIENCVQRPLSDAKYNRWYNNKYRCIIDEDIIGGNFASDVKTIKEIRFRENSILWDTDTGSKPSDFNQFTAYFDGVWGLTSAHIPTIAEGTTTVGRSYTARINVYSDTDDDLHGDTPISIAGEGDQTVIVRYSTGTVADQKPKLELVEPPGKYLNYEGQIPIAVNAWNADSITLKISSTDGRYNCEFSGADMMVTTAFIEKDCGTLITSERTTYKKPDEPPFIEYLWEPIFSNDYEMREAYVLYDIEVTAKSKDAKYTTVTKRVAFSEGLTKENLMICQGIGKCSGPYEHGEKIDANSLHEFNQSATPIGLAG